jgi:hypothetical protein
VYGCGDETLTPTEPMSQLIGTARLELQTCGEDTYLSELSLVLPVWQDSLASWQPDTTLAETPEWTGAPVMRRSSCGEMALPAASPSSGSGCAPADAAQATSPAARRDVRRMQV